MSWTKWLWEWSQKAALGLTMIAVVSVPTWIGSAVAMVRTVSETEERSLANEKQFEQIQEDLKYLKLLIGVAIASPAGDTITASVNTRGHAGRFKQGEEIWVTNNSDMSETRLKIKVEGTFRDDPVVLLELSREAALALKFVETETDGEIQVAIEPLGLEGSAD